MDMSHRVLLWGYHASPLTMAQWAGTDQRARRHKVCCPSKVALLLIRKQLVSPQTTAASGPRALLELGLVRHVAEPGMNYAQSRGHPLKKKHQ